jgi:hypothetical protein
MLTFLMATLAASADLCDKPAPEPRGYHSRGFGQVAEIFPPRSRRNPGEQPVAYMYEVGYPGSRWDVRAKRMWTATLPHTAFPAEALVSMDGHLVTFDDHHQLGQVHAVVVFDAQGRQRAAYRLDELLTAAQTRAFERSDCGVHWRREARYYFLLGSAPRLYVVLPSLTLELDLEGGGFRRGDAGSFAGLAAVMREPFPDEEVEVWSTSLRFSSLTDLLAGP